MSTCYFLRYSSKQTVAAVVYLLWLMLTKWLREKTLVKPSILVELNYAHTYTSAFKKRKSLPFKMTEICTFYVARAFLKENIESLLRV